MLNHPIEPLPLVNFAYYRILDNKLLGKGPNSLVYEGVNIISGEHVCIKIIFLNDRIQHELALNELSCLKQISHPQILRYLYDFQTKNNIYIVTEICEETLYNRLARHGRFE
jgi:serine/threonine protein kinase